MDIQRKIAMEIRRADLLKDIPYTLNKNIFDVLIKQLCYQLAEIYMNLYELKFEKIVKKLPPNRIHENFMKTSDIVKCNEYATHAVAYLQKFIHMYEKSNESPNVPMSARKEIDVNYNAMTSRELAALPCLEPDTST